MKTIMTIICVAVMAFAFVGCDSETDNPPAQPTPMAIVSTAEPVTAEILDRNGNPLSECETAFFVWAIGTAETINSDACPPSFVEAAYNGSTAEFLAAWESLKAENAGGNR